MTNLLDPYAGHDATTGPDAELIYLHAECVRLDREFMEATTDADQSALSPAVDHAMGRLVARPAQTVVGLHLKLDFCRLYGTIVDEAVCGYELLESALDDAKRLAEVTDTPDPVVALVAQYHDTLATINAFDVKDGPGGDAELNKFLDDVFDPVRENLVATRPTTRAGLAALLDVAVNDPDMDYNESWMMPGLIENARDAVKEAAVGAMVPLVKDPIFSLITACEEARTTMNAEQARFNELRSKIPAEVVNWPGVISGMSNVQTDGIVHPKFLYSEKQVREHFAEARAAVEARARLLVAEDPRYSGELLAIDAAERQALAEVAEHERVEAEWCESAGLPFTPEGEDEHIAPFINAVFAAETAVIEGPPTTLAGFAAKVAFVAGLEMDREPTLTAFARDAAALSGCGCLAPASDARIGGSGAVQASLERPVNGAV